MRPTRLLAALAGTVLALTALAATPPAQAAGTGTLTVNLKDEHGKPIKGSLAVVTSDGSMLEVPPGGQSSWELTVPVGPYAVAVINPWAGLMCAGADPCDYFAIMTGALEPDESVSVREDRVTKVVLEADPPARVKGSPTFGSLLEIAWSEGMDDLITSLGPLTGGALAPQVEWLRNGEPIAGATEDTYRVEAADVGKTIGARISYGPGAQQQFQLITGEPVEPRTLRGARIGKVRTKAYTTIFDPTISADRQGRMRVDVTAPNQVIPGKVTVAVGSWSQTRSLRNGSARFVLPQLPRGKHTVTAKFLGTEVYAPATAKPRTITVG